MAQQSILGRARKAAKKAKSVATTFRRPRHCYAWHYKYSPVAERTILFESFHGKTVSDSPFHMLLEFLHDERSQGFTMYYASSRAGIEDHQRLIDALGLQDKVQLVAVESMRYARILATTKYLVNNSSFPAYFTRRPEQRYIQTWHGTPLKTLGKQMRLGIESMYNVQHNFLQADMLTFPNEFTREVIMRDYNLDDLYTGKAALLGYPRNDVFFKDEAATEIKRYYGLNGMETFAYMPTWRGANNYTVDVNNYRDEVMELLERIDATLRDDQMMFVNFHSMVAAQMGDFEFDHVFPFPKTRDSYDFLSAMDVLVTDYSSVFFDFSLTRRPIILYAYDEQEYLAERGMYLNINDLPFPKASTTEELLAMLETGLYRRQSYVGSDYERKFLAHDSADNSKLALDLLFQGEARGVPVVDYAHNASRPWRTVAPMRQRTLADIRTACEAADPERDILLFQKPAFNEDKSRLLHDEYRDKGNYMFATKAYNCTVAEELLLDRSAHVRESVMRRERDRVFPNLNVPAEPAGNVYVGEIGTSIVYRQDDIPRIGAKVKYSKKGNLELALDPADYELRRIMLVKANEIVASVDLTEDERSRRLVTRSVRTLVKAFHYRDDMRLNVMLHATDPTTGRATPLALALKNPAETTPDDKTEALFKPFVKKEEDSGRTLVIAPYKSDTNQLSISARREDKYLTNFKRASLVHVQTQGETIAVSATMGDGEFVVLDFVLRFRSDTELFELPVPYRLHVRDGQLRFDATIVPRDIPFRGVYWDVFIIVQHRGLRGSVPVTLTRNQELRLKLGNQQWRVGDDRVVFTHIAKGHVLSFAYRHYYPTLDTYALRLKEFAALAVFAAGHPYWKRKRMWLVYEKFSKLAQDNAFYFFQYCMGLPEEQRAHVYYVIDKSSPDYANVRAYGRHVIDFMSFRHMLYAMVAKIYIGSDSKTHLYTWRRKPSLVWDRMSKHKVFFLQHGVTAMKRVDYLFGKQGSSPMAYFLTTSQREQDIVVENFGYKTNQAPVLGFSRWDALDDRRTPGKPLILVMPTWRAWLEEQSEEEFVKSEYFERYSSFIQSERLAELLERHDARMVFFIHPKLSEQLGNFRTTGDRVQLVAQGSRQLNEIIMECDMLVTDYSSVCWDVAYLDKPIVFYQFDREAYNEWVGGYIDFDHDLPGDSCTTEKQAIQAIEDCAARGFAMRESDAALAGEWFAHKDRDNRKRTYNFIVDRGF